MEVKLEKLTVSERKAFKQRVKYWLGRGLTKKEAENKAAEKLSDAGKVVRFPSRVAEKPDVELRNPCKATNLTSDAEDECLTLDAKRDDKETIPDKPDKPRQKHSLDDFWSSLPFSAIAELAACLIVMAGATTFLVVATVAVLGDTWLGWVQALTLELGAVVVAMIKFQLNFHSFLTKTVMVGLVVLSGNILHTGVEKNRSHKTTTALANDEVLNNLRSRRKVIEDIYKNRPKNQVSNRTKDLKLLTEIDKEIKVELVKLKNSKTVIDSKSDTDLFIRLGLMVLNLVLAHHFMFVVRRNCRKMFHVEHF